LSKCLLYCLVGDQRHVYILKNETDTNTEEWKRFGWHALYLYNRRVEKIWVTCFISI